MSRWDRHVRRRIEVICDKLMRHIGTNESLILEIEEGGQAMHWRKPLRIDEINRMAPTPEVRERKGRP